MEAARRRWWLSLLVSTAAAVVATVWLANPATYPYGSGDITRSGVNHLIERNPAAVMLLSFAALGVVAAVITISAPKMLVEDTKSGSPAAVATGLLFFPFPSWGPLLGAAVLAYWLRRTEPHRITRAAVPARRPEAGH